MIWEGGPLKPGFGLSGDVHTSQTLLRATNYIVFMPWGLTRFHESGQSHFVTFCCYHRHRLFTTDASRRTLMSALARCGVVTDFAFTGTWSCRSMFTSCCA